MENEKRSLPLTTRQAPFSLLHNISKERDKQANPEKERQRKEKHTPFRDSMILLVFFSYLHDEWTGEQYQHYSTHYYPENHIIT